MMKKNFKVGKHWLMASIVGGLSLVSVGLSSDYCSMWCNQPFVTATSTSCVADQLGICVGSCTTTFTPEDGGCVDLVEPTGVDCSIRYDLIDVPINFVSVCDDDCECKVLYAAPPEYASYNRVGCDTPRCD